MPLGGNVTTPAKFSVLDGGPSREEREERLAAGADELESARGSASIFGDQRLLLAVAAGLMTLGLCLILLGWLGAARSTVVEEQVPYLISGGLLGVALAVIGAVTLFAHWLTVMIREARVYEAARRQDHVELIDALRSLSAAGQTQEDSDGRARGTRAQRPVRRAPRSS
jgi:hypothetical protein